MVQDFLKNIIQKIYLVTFHKKNLILFIVPDYTKSKGIEIFIKLQKNLKNIFFYIWRTEFLSSDSINEKDILFWESQLKNIKFFGNCEDPLLYLDKAL